jgi:tetratricopeptide (TPR) repeat protein
MREAAIWSELGNLYTLLSEYDAAIVAFERAMSLETENPRLYDSLAFACYKKGQLEKAQGFFEKAMQLSEDDEEKAGILRHLADLHVGLRKYRRAAMVYETADLFALPVTPLDPDSIAPPLVTLPPQMPAATQIASAPLGQGIADETPRQRMSIRQVEMAPQAEPGVDLLTEPRPLEIPVARPAPETASAPMVAYSADPIGRPKLQTPDGREPREIEVFRLVTKANPDNDRAWFTLGNNLKTHGRIREAIEAYETAIALNSRAEAYHFELGAAYASLKEYEVAASEFRQVVQLAPENLFAQASLAACYRHLGDMAEMRKHADLIAVRMMQESNYNRACFESICGNTERAIQLLRAAVAEGSVTAEMLRTDPDLEFVREAPAFQTLMQFFS